MHIVTGLFVNIVATVLCRCCITFTLVIINLTFQTVLFPSWQSLAAPCKEAKADAMRTIGERYRFVEVFTGGDLQNKWLTHFDFVRGLHMKHI